MNKRFLIVSVLLGLLSPEIGLSQARPALVEEMGWADSILVNGKIVSMDERSIVPNTPGNIYEAMAIKGKRIMALGSDDEMQSLAGSKTRTIDLGGKTLIPGLIQTHYHLYNTAGRKYGPQFGLTSPTIKLDMVAETTPEATARKLRDVVLNAIRVQRLPKDGNESESGP